MTYSLSRQYQNRGFIGKWKAFFGHAVQMIVVIAAAGINAQVVDSPYVVGTWRGFASAAVSFTFDDGCSGQFTTAIPMFDQKQFKLTLFTIVGGSNPPNWQTLGNAAAKGHEVASHTMTHTSFSGMTPATQEYELKNSKDSINRHIGASQCITMAYPYCVEGADSINKKHYLGARTCSGQIVPKNPLNYSAISSFGCGSESANNTTESITRLANNAVASNGWCILLFHGVENDGGYSPVSRATLQGCVDVMDQNRNKFWVETFGNVIRYIYERRVTSVKEIAASPDSIVVQVSDTLDDKIFNYPLSIGRRLPSGWQAATVFQAGVKLASAIKDSSGSNYLYFDAVPDGGTVVILKSITANRLYSEALPPPCLTVMLNGVGIPFSAFDGKNITFSIVTPTGARVSKTLIHLNSRYPGQVVLPGRPASSGMVVVHATDGTTHQYRKCILP